MRILFVNTAPIIKYGIGAAFADLGHEVKLVFLDREESLYPYLKEFKPDYVFNDGGINRMPKLFPLLDEMKIPHMYWAIEDPAAFDYLSLPYARKSSHVFTPCLESIELYRKNGINAHLLMFGCHPRFHCRGEKKEKFRHDIIFVGSNYDYHPARLKGIDDILRALIDNHYDIKIYGNEWWLDKSRPYYISPEYYGGLMPYEELPSAYASAKIVIGLHSVDNSLTMMSMRTFEVLGCGGFYLTQWTPSIEYFFKNHYHLVWTKSSEETFALVNWYLEHPQEREKIALRGQEEVYRKHTYHVRILEVLSGAGW